MQEVPFMQYHFHQQGYKEVLATVDSHNQRPLKFHALLRFREPGRKVVTDSIFGRPHMGMVSYKGCLLTKLVSKHS